MNKIITIFILFITTGLSQNEIPSSLLDLSDYANNEQIDRKTERFHGINPYNVAGFLYTKSLNIRTDDLIQRDVDWHYGTSLIVFGIGVNVKQYWFESKYKAVSYFSSASSSFSVVLGMGKEAEGLGLDIQILASGVDINLIRFNNFDIGLSAGIGVGGSFVLMKGAPAPFVNISIKH